MLPTSPPSGPIAERPAQSEGPGPITERPPGAPGITTEALPEAIETNCLPLADAAAVERADAARNRRRILAAVDRLLAERSVDCISMDAVCEAAQVGKGTLFRRFGDRSSLFRSVLEERERAFQEAFIRGAPPLGPGAPAPERLVAFGHAYLERFELIGELLRAAETGAFAARLRAGVYSAYHAHVRTLVATILPDVDADYVADALLSALAAELVMHQRRTLGMSLERLQQGWCQLIEALGPTASA